MYYTLSLFQYPFYKMYYMSKLHLERKRLPATFPFFFLKLCIYIRKKLVEEIHRSPMECTGNQDGQIKRMKKSATWQFFQWRKPPKHHVKHRIASHHLGQEKLCLPTIVAIHDPKEKRQVYEPKTKPLPYVTLTLISFLIFSTFSIKCSFLSHQDNIVHSNSTATYSQHTQYSMSNIKGYY